MINTRYDFKKTLQAACRFISNFNGKLNYTKLLKLMYLADRESLEVIERPITGDAFYALHNGPILSNVYELIKGQDWRNKEQEIWNEYIEKYRYDLSSIKDPGMDELSEFEVETIDRISGAFKDYSLKEMINYCHNNLPEWDDLGDTSIPIHKEIVLSYLGKSDEEIEAIREELESIETLRDILGEQ